MTIPYVGDILFLKDSIVTGFPNPKIEYEWNRDAIPIDGASGPQYTVITDDVGTYIGLKISVSNIYGDSFKIYGYNQVEGVVELPSFIVQPILVSSSDPPRVNNPVSIQDLDIRGNPNPSIEYSWFSGSTLIDGVTGSTYYPRPGDVGNTLSSIITLSSPVGTAQTTIFLDNSVVDANLEFRVARINTPVLVGSNATLTTDIISSTGIDYFWVYRDRGNFVPFSGVESPLIESSLSGKEIKAKIIAYGFSGGETTDIEIETPLVTVTESSSVPSSSYLPQGTLIPGSGFVDSFVEKGTTLATNNADVFASESYPAFRLGFPDQYTMGADGFTLDMYAFHGSDIKSVMVSCDGGTEVTAGFAQVTNGETGEGHFYIGVSADKFPAGGTFEVRATANPINGYSRSQKLLLTHATGENKISIDTSTSWRDAYDTLLTTYDESKRNIIELTETGEYIIDGSSNAYRGFTYGWIEVIPADGVVPTIDISTGGINRSGEDDSIRPRMNALKVTNCIFKRLLVDETETNYDNGWYTEDFSNSRMWFHGCTFQSDWFDTGSYNLLNNPILWGFMRIGEAEGKQISFEDCYFDQTGNGPVGAYLTKNVTCNKTVKDTYTNVHACINSRSTDKLNPANSSLHADHWQLFTNNVTDGLYLVENYILYGYSGSDYDANVQPFGFFGTGRETYRDIAVVNSGWTGPLTSANQAQLGYTYDHIILNGVDLYKRSLGFPHGNQIGPVLVRGVNATEGGRLKNSILHPLDVVSGATYGPGSIKEFRVQNSSPDFEFFANPSSDSLLNLRYEWHIAGASMANVNDTRSFYIGEPDGTNTNFLTGITAGGPSGPAKISDIFYLSDFTSAGSGRWAQFNGLDSVTTLVLYGVNSREEAEILDLQDYYLRLQTSKGSMTSKTFSVRDDSIVCDFIGFSEQLFSGVTMSWSDIIDSPTGVTFQLFQVAGISNIEPAFWLSSPEPSIINPIVGSTLGISGGVYSGTPEPTFTYTWSQRAQGESFFGAITGVTGATLDLTTNPYNSGTEIKLDIQIENIHGSDIATLDYGSLKDWNTNNDGIFSFPAGMDNNYKDVTIIEQPSSFFSGITQASLVDSESEEGRLKFNSNIQGPFYIGVWDGSAWSVYKTWDALSLEQLYSNYAGPGGQPSAEEIFTLYQNDPGDPTQFSNYTADWDTYKDGIYRFPSQLDSTARSVVVLESPTTLAGATQAFIDT